MTEPRVVSDQNPHAMPVQRRVVAVLMFLAILGSVAVGVAFATYHQAGKANKSSEQAQQSSEQALLTDRVNGCMRDLRSDIDRADQRIAEVGFDLDAGLIQGVVAAVTEDRAELQRLVAMSDEVLADAEDALTQRREASAKYAELNDLQKQDPEKFLELCDG